jgi:hypothetical protein
MDRRQDGCRVVGVETRSCASSLTVPTLGMASKGKLSKAPILEKRCAVLVRVVVQYSRGGSFKPSRSRHRPRLSGLQGPG